MRGMGGDKSNDLTQLIWSEVGERFKYRIQLVYFKVVYFGGHYVQKQDR